MAGHIPDIFYCCRPCLSRLTVQKRAFTSTTPQRKHGAVPSFHPTQSPDLDALLTKFRSNIFVPAHLIQLQKQLVYKRSNSALLTNPDEPATVRLGNEVFQLHPLDRTRDEPPTRKSFHRILELMGESGDWRNLAGFLEGLKTAKRKLDEAILQKLVRKANEAGQMGIILDCIRRVDGTGLRLSNSGVAKEVMLGAIVRACQGEWSEEAVSKAVRYAENIWQEMWDPKHAKLGEGNPRTQPEIIGILVQLHAAKVSLFGVGEEEVGLVQKYTVLLLKNWEHANLLIREEDWMSANNFLISWSPVWHGMKMARQVVGEETSLGKALGQKIEQELEPLLQKSLLLLEGAAPGDGKRRGSILFEELSNVLPS